MIPQTLRHGSPGPRPPLHTHNTQTRDTYHRYNTTPKPTCHIRHSIMVPKKVFVISFRSGTTPPFLRLYRALSTAPQSSVAFLLSSAILRMTGQPLCSLPFTLDVPEASSWLASGHASLHGPHRSDGVFWCAESGGTTCALSCCWKMRRIKALTSQSCYKDSRRQSPRPRFVLIISPAFGGRARHGIKNKHGASPIQTYPRAPILALPPRTCN